MAMEFKESIYVWEIAKGLWITIRHFVRNLFNMRGLPTLRYPEEKNVYPPRFRGRHRLTQYADERLKCTACMLCATACPAKCIYIEAVEKDDQKEKYPQVYNIDMLKCVMCGLCVEACPCDAIRMDTGIHPPPADNREAFIFRIQDLIKYPEIKVQNPPQQHRCGKL